MFRIFLLLCGAHVSLAKRCMLFPCEGTINYQNLSLRKLTSTNRQQVRDEEMLNKLVQSLGAFIKEI